MRTWWLYIFKVFRQVHSNTGTSNKVVNIMNSLIDGMFDRPASNADKINKTKTLSSQETQTAVRVMLPGEPGKHAMRRTLAFWALDWRIGCFTSQPLPQRGKGEGQGGRCCREMWVVYGRGAVRSGPPEIGKRGHRGGWDGMGVCPTPHLTLPEVHSPKVL